MQPWKGSETKPPPGASPWPLAMFTDLFLKALGLPFRSSQDSKTHATSQCCTVLFISPCGEGRVRPRMGAKFQLTRDKEATSRQ